VTLRRLILGTLLAAFDGPIVPGWALDLVAEGLAGHVLFGNNIIDPPQVAALCAALRAARPDVVIGIDEEGGDVTRLGHVDGSPYPGNGALGVIDDPALTTAIYRAIGADLAAVGIDLDLAPTIDVNTASDNPVIGTRSFGADPTLVARHAVAAVLGLQDAGVAACAKHFPGHGATTADSHLELPTVDADLDTLLTRDIPPFAAAAAAGIQAIMTAHIRIPLLTGEAPATFSPAALEILRTRIGFRGVIITDALEMQGAARFAGGAAPGAVLALIAGADLLCIGSRVTAESVEEIVAAVIEAVADGRLSRARLEEAVERNQRLAAWTRATRSPSGASAAVNGADLGVSAARRAVAVEGSLPDLTNALVVQLEATTTIAQGRVPWGVVPHIGSDLGAASVRVAASEADATEIIATAAGRPIVITGRNLHRLTGAASLIESIAGSCDVVIVEMGWPTAWRPRGVRGFITTHGASRANGRAAAEALGIAA